jgi:hypothetical protein
MLKDGWFVPESIETTLKNFIREEVAPEYDVRSVTVDTFETGLIDELRTLAVFPEEEQEALAVKYIHNNRDLLFEFARNFFAQR